MKDSVKIFLKTVIIGLMCSAIFIGSGYLYLENSLKPAESPAESIPYYSTPENAGVLFQICGNSTLIFLDFENKSLKCIFADNIPIDEGKIAGYSIDFTVSGNYELLGGIVDCVGGIELETNDTTFSFTGIQVEELFSTTTNTGAIKKQTIQKIFEKIRENGFKKEDILYIIKNSETDLSVPDCYYWNDYIKELCKNVSFIG